MTGSCAKRGFDGPPAEVNATTIRNPRGGSDGTRTYLLRQPHDSNNEVGRRVACGTRRWTHPRPVPKLGCPSSLLIQREWYRWWPYDERRNPGRRARALAEITRSMGRGAGQRNREGPQQSTRSD